MFALQTSRQFPWHSVSIHAPPPPPPNVISASVTDCAMCVLCLFRFVPARSSQPYISLCRCHYTKSIPIYDHSNISSKKLQKQNFKPLGHYTCMQCGTSHLQKVQENILSRIILATYRKFIVTTVRFTQNVS